MPIMKETPSRGVIITKKGDKTRFWLDPWLYNEPICMRCPLLFEISENKHITVFPKPWSIGIYLLGDGCMRICKIVGIGFGRML